MAILAFMEFGRFWCKGILKFHTPHMTAECGGEQCSVPRPASGLHLSVTERLWRRAALTPLLLTSFLTHFLSEFSSSSWRVWVASGALLWAYQKPSVTLLVKKGPYRYVSICFDCSTSTQQADAAEQARLGIVHLQGQQRVGEGEHQVCQRAEAGVVHLGPVQRQAV